MTERSDSYDSPRTMQALVCDLASAGDRDALVTFDGDKVARISFRMLAAEVEAVARTLSRKGVRAGEPVALCGPGGADWIVACLAVLRCGACAVPVDTQLTIDTFRHVLKDSGARIALVARSSTKRFDVPLQEAGIEVLPLARAEDLDVAGDHDFPVVNPDDRAILFYTSGTTGPPKGVPLTQRNIAFQIGVIAEAGLVSSSDRLLLPLPLHHVYPLVIGVFTPLALRIAIVLPDGFTGTRIVAALAQGRATLMIGVPRLYDALVGAVEERVKQRGRVAGILFDFLLRLSRTLRRSFGWSVGKLLFASLHRRFGPSLRTVVSGGAALKPETAWTLEALGWQVGTGYGLTETAPLLTIHRPGETRFETAGRSVPGMELRIDRTADQGPFGEVLARGPGVFAGYRGLPEKTKDAFTSDGWFRTGDLGRLDDEGWLHLAGRRSTLIVTEGGENVQPDQIEDAYEAHPVIAEIAVFERKGGIAALIVPARKARRDDATEREVREAVREVSRTLPSYQRLAEYRLTSEAIPRTRLGKPQRHLIENRYERAAKDTAEHAGEQVEPVPIDEFSGEDQALLENETAYAAFTLLVDRFPGRRVTPDSDLQLDLEVDSIDWLELSLEISEHTGVALSEEAIGEIRTVRNLLARLEQGGDKGATLTAPLDDPEAALDDRQRLWLQPRNFALRALGRIVAVVNRVAMRTLFGLQVRGADNVPAEGPFVLAPNHTSFLDPFALAAALHIGRLEKLYWAGWTGIVFGGPVRRFFARVAGIVPVDPARATASSLAFGSAVLQRGLGLAWFPEGMRSRDGSLQPFRPGIGLVLERWRVPVVPVIIRGTFDAWPRSRRLPRFHRIDIEILAPIKPAELAGEGKGDTDAKRIVHALHSHMSEVAGNRDGIASSGRDPGERVRRR